MNGRDETTDRNSPSPKHSVKDAVPINRRRIVSRLCLLTAGILVATVAVTRFLLPAGEGQFEESRSTGSKFRQFEFDVSNATIPVEQILPGGPGKDGIPALTDPGFEDADTADWLKADDRVIGVTIGNESHAYPLRILDQHEIVNDVVADLSVAVTYCPLCDSALVFDRRVGDETLELGVSGLLYNSNVLMFDRRPEGETESLWSQMGRKAVAGPLVGKELQAVPVELTTWRSWQQQHPDTQVLAWDTGFGRNYSQPVYGPYFASQDLMFPAQPLDDRLPLKTPVLAIWTDSASAAIPVSTVRVASKDGTFRTSIAGKEIELKIDPESDSVRVASTDADVNWAYSFWFAWHAFHQDSELFSAPDE